MQSRRENYEWRLLGDDPPMIGTTLNDACGSTQPDRHIL
jgi:hypothetical protein